MEIQHRDHIAIGDPFDHLFDALEISSAVAGDFEVAIKLMLNALPAKRKAQRVRTAVSVIVDLSFAWIRVVDPVGAGDETKIAAGEVCAANQGGRGC